MDRITLALFIGFIWDLIWGDPRWLPHPVVLMGKIITKLETALRAIFPKTAAGEKAAGGFLALLLPLGAFGVSYGLLWLLGRVSPWLRVAGEAFMCYQVLATKDLKQESMAVYWCLRNGDLAAARLAVGRIVGRDVNALDETGVTKAAVETVAENTADGVIAPMLYLALGGAPLGFAYKAVNTMDSMVAYHNEKYEHFGFFPARLDDAANFLPARIAGLCMVVSAFFTGLSGKNAAKIFARDRYNHASPNSAQTEAVMAGALEVQLAGDAVYFGRVVHKKTIGDAIRPVEVEDIRRANRLMMATSVFCLSLCILVRIGMELL